MVCGLDLHRGQITFDALVEETGELWRGRLWSPIASLSPLARSRSDGPGRGPAGQDRRRGAHRLALRRRGDHGGRLRAAPLRARRDSGGGRKKKRAKTDRSDSELQRVLLANGELPESWIPPEGVLEWRERTRLYKTLVDERRCGSSASMPSSSSTACPCPKANACRRDPGMASERGRRAQPGGSPAHRGAYRMIDAVEHEVASCASSSSASAPQTGVSGPAPVPLRHRTHRRGDDLGRARRLPTLHRSMQVVRHAGLDVTVHTSDNHRSGGHLSKEGPGRCAGCCSRRACAWRGQRAPTTPTTKT